MAILSGFPLQAVTPAEGGNMVCLNVHYTSLLVCHTASAVTV